LAERPRHGYDLEQVIKERGMREWTELAFSSIYYVLKKLQKRKLVEPGPRHEEDAGTRRIYRLTPAGRRILQEVTIEFLRDPHPVYPSVLLGLGNWPCAEHQQALEALRQRRSQLRADLKRLTSTSRSVPDRPVFVEVLFDFSITQLISELAWLDTALDKLGEEHEN
jgi:DNA-binding PadR family transcriptional regulator